MTIAAAVPSSKPKASIPPRRNEGESEGLPRFDTFDLELQVDPKSKLDEGEFEGLAVSFGSDIDAWVPTVIKPGAFKKTLKESGERIRILWAHRRDMMIGFPTELREDKEGIFVRARLVNAGKGAEALELLRLAQMLGKRVDLSIGIEIIRDEMERDPKTQEPKKRFVHEGKITEISLVFMGADREAGVTEVNEKQDLVDRVDQLVALKASIDALLTTLGADPKKTETPGAGGDATPGKTDAGDALSTSADGEEGFEGRVLNKKNLTRLKEIVGQLQTLLSEAEKVKEEEAKEAAAAKKAEEKQEAPDRLALLNEAELAHAETLQKVQEVLR